MTDLKIVNAKCYDVFYFRYGICDKAYSPELYEKELKRIIKLEEELNLFIENHLEEIDLYQDNREIYYIQLYVAHYMETLLDDQQYDDLLNSLLATQAPQSNFLSPLVLILLSDQIISKDIIAKIYKQCEIALLSDYSNLGKLPYDYRYHILKREETPEDVVGKILASYDDIELDDLHDLVESIMYELNYDLVKYEIRDISQIKAIPMLRREHHYFLVMKKYYFDRAKKEKRV